VDPHQKVTRLLTKARPTKDTRPEAYRPPRRSYEVYRETGENFRSVRVQISGDHFQIDTHDMGSATEEFWGDSDYEFWAVVEKTEWSKLLAALAKEVGSDSWARDPETWARLGATRQAKLLLSIARALFTGDSRATDRFRELCEEHGVECSGGSWV
jgi:hypothetical protein